MAGKRILSRVTRSKSKESGLTLVEVVIALAVLVMTLIGLVSGISYASRTNGVILEDEAAMRGAQKMIETMRSYPLKYVWTCFNNTYPANNGLISPLTTVGDAPLLSNTYGWTAAAYPEQTDNTFDVEGLTPVGATDLTGEPGGWAKCGRIYFPGSNLVNACTLVEVTATTDPLYDPQGTDLNCDTTLGQTLTVVSPCPVNSPYNVLPVTLVIRWKGLGGVRTMSFRYILTSPATYSTGDFKYPGQ